MKKKKIIKAALNAALIVSVLPLVSVAQSEDQAYTKPAITKQKQAYTKPDITKHGSLDLLRTMQSTTRTA